MHRIVLVVALLAAGCIAPSATLDASDVGIVVGGIAAGDVSRWNGSVTGPPLTLAMQENDLRCWMTLPCDASAAACEDVVCERTPFTIRGDVAAVVLSIRWPTVVDAKADAWIEDASGAVVAPAPRVYPYSVGLVSRLDDPAPGDYTAVIVARASKVEYQAALRVVPRVAEGAPRELLPDLATLPPTDLTLETPGYFGASYFTFPIPGLREVATSAGLTGCRIDERAENTHTRCLRFSNAVANLGEGPLDVRLAPGSTQFVQYVHASDGSTTEHPGGPAEWHATHAHWHNAARNSYTVHAIDPETRALGEAVGEGRKGGICFADTATADVGLPVMEPQHFNGWGCLQPLTENDGWRMGISPGWYDLYPYMLGDQYVNLAGVADGTYAVCSATNADGELRETDLSNNVACTAFRLTGDAIELLDPPPYHAIPPGSRM